MTAKDSTPTRGPARAELLLFLAGSTAWIFLLYSAFHPLWQGDSGGYTHPGCAIWGPLDIRAWDGGRTPLYPLFLTLIQHLLSGTCVSEPGSRVLEVVTAAQLVGYLASLLYLYRALAGSPRVVRVVGMALVALSPLHAYFARAILTEALAASILNVLLAHLILFTRHGRTRRDATVVFAAFTLLVLTRPSALLPLLPLVAFVLWAGTERVRLLGRFVLATVLPLVALALFNQVNQRHFRLTTLDGYIKTQVVYDVFDRVHPEDAVLGEIMSRQYRQELAAGGSDGLVVWRAVDEIRRNLDRMPFRKRRGPGTCDLNAYLDRVSTYLILENPGAVLRKTATSVVQFWNADVVAVPPAGADPRSPGHDSVIAHDGRYALHLRAQAAYHALGRACIILVPLLLLGAALRRGARSVALAALLYLVYLANFVFAAAFNAIQPRYVLIAQPLLLLAACLAIEALAGARRPAAAELAEAAPEAEHAAP